MAEISEIVSVSITTDSKSPSRAGFGTPCYLSYHTRFAESYRTYSSLAEMAADGFVSYDDAYRFGVAVFAANPTVESIVIGRLPAAPSFTTDVVITSAVEGAHVKFKVIEPETGTVQSIDYTILAAATTSTVATAVELLTEAVAGVNSSASTATITLTPAVAGRRVIVYDCENCTVKETTADAGFDDELTALQIQNDSWYFVAIQSESEANIDLVATWVSTRKKLFFCSSNASDELAGTGTIGADQKTLVNNRIAGLWANNPAEIAAGRFIAAGAPKDPGSVTWVHKTLPGLTTKTLTSTERSNLETDNWNHYQTVATLNITRPGVTFGGEWIDITHGIDALEAAISEDVFALLANSDKVPFTEAGFDLIANAILGAMKRFEGTVDQPSLLVQGTSQVIMPKLSAVSGANKSARRLTGVRFSADLAGAIHYVSVVGTLSNA